MILWLDAQLSPRLCSWIADRFSVQSIHVRDLDLREAEDRHIFNRARTKSAVLFTKDEDFVDLVRRHNAPPQVLWLRCGNMSNARLKRLLSETLPDALTLLRDGEPIVEIGTAERKPGARKKGFRGHRQRSRSRRSAVSTR